MQGSLTLNCLGARLEKVNIKFFPSAFLLDQVKSALWNSFTNVQTFSQTFFHETKLGESCCHYIFPFNERHFRLSYLGPSLLSLTRMTLSCLMTDTPVALGFRNRYPLQRKIATYLRITYYRRYAKVCTSWNFMLVFQVSRAQPASLLIKRRPSLLLHKQWPSWNHWQNLETLLKYPIFKMFNPDYWIFVGSSRWTPQMFCRFFWNIGEMRDK